MRQWFFATFSNQVKETKQKYYDYMYKNEVQIFFFDWFEEHFL